MKRRSFVAEVVLCTALIAGAAAHGAERTRDEVPDDFKCGPIDCDVIKDHPNKRYLLQFKASADGEPLDVTKIQDFRDEFWKTYPDKKGHEEAREKFAQALFLKDMFCLQNYMRLTILSPVPNAVERGEDMPAKVGEFLSGFGDGGVPKTARYEFYVWAEKVRANLGAVKSRDDIFITSLRVGMGSLSPAFYQASDLGGKEYQAYLMERDWGEFEQAHRVPAGFDNKQYFGIYLYYRYGGYPFAEAKATYAALKATLKNDRVIEDAAEMIRTAPRKDNGDLVVTVPDPVKKGPGGDLVDDYDVPMPEKVVGTYRDPLVAFEVAIAQGGDREYLHYLLAQQAVFNRKLMREKITKWVYAGEAYEALVHAFGAQEVAWGAQRVRTAKKRMITGNIMDQTALGATRNEPFHAFEDMMCRKDPTGFVKVAIAFQENLEHPASVDVLAEYRKLVGSDEKQVLEAATRVAARTPWIISRQEWDAIKQDMARGPEPEKPAPVLVDNPDFLAWKKFASGTKVNLITRTWYQPVRGNDKLISKTSEEFTYTLKSVSADRVDYWLTEHVYDNNGQVHPPHDTEMAYPAKWELPANAGPRTRMRNPAEAKGTEMGPGRMARDVVQGDVEKQSGEEELEIGGRMIHAQWKSEKYPVEVKPWGKGTLLVKVWTSDEVPGNLVRKTQDTVVPADNAHPGWRALEETSVVSLEGCAPGKPAAVVRSDYVPPELGFSLAMPRPTNLDKPPPVVQKQVIPFGRQPVTSPAPVAGGTDATDRMVPGRARNANALSPEVQKYTELIRQSSAVANRMALVKRQFMLRQRRNEELPAEVKEAADRFDPDMKSVATSMGQRDTAAWEAGIKKLNEDVTVAEKYFKRADSEPQDNGRPTATR